MVPFLWINFNLIFIFFFIKFLQFGVQNCIVVYGQNNVDLWRGSVEVVFTNYFQKLVIPNCCGRIGREGHLMVDCDGVTAQMEQPKWSLQFSMCFSLQSKHETLYLLKTDLLLTAVDKIVFCLLHFDERKPVVDCRCNIWVFSVLLEVSLYLVKLGRGCLPVKSRCGWLLLSRRCV